MKKIRLILAFLMLTFYSQSQDTLNFLEPSPQFNKNRFHLAIGASSIGFIGSSYALYNTWYKQYPLTSFHLFNDVHEWNQMDKMGHIYTSYFLNSLSSKVALWTGMKRKNSLTSGILCATLFQTTIEVMDGFSSEWGFSFSDIAANTLGTASYVSQELLWNEQKFLFKMSSSLSNYPQHLIQSVNQKEKIQLSDRANDLFGSSLPEKFLKDYNSQTTWLSININAITNRNWVPDWLNISVGYGSENLFGGFKNQWISNNGNDFNLDPVLYPRIRQYYLSFDADLTRIPTDSPFLKTLLFLVNIFKIPAPAIEYNSKGQTKFHFLFW